jgi:hypothetical protein
MITIQDIELLYCWAKSNKFPMKRGGGRGNGFEGVNSYGYSNKPLSFCWIKKVMKTTTLRKLVTDISIQKILNNDDILFSMIISLDGGTEIGPHKDPNNYREPYKRIQIPLKIPDKEKCYMIWKGEKIHWNEGEPQLFEVMDYIHEGYNLSDEPMELLLIDVKKEVQVQIK